MRGHRSKAVKLKLGKSLNSLSSYLAVLLSWHLYSFCASSKILKFRIFRKIKFLKISRFGIFSSRIGVFCRGLGYPAKGDLIIGARFTCFGNFLDLLTEAVENSARDFRDVEVDYEKILCNREALAFQRIPKFPQKFQKNKNAPEQRQINDLTFREKGLD